MIYDCGSSSIIMIPSRPTGVLDRPWSMIVALPGSLWYLSIKLVWLTGHDVWLWLFLDHYDTSPSSWRDGQAMICDNSSSWIIMTPSLPAGVMYRPRYIPFQLVWWTVHDLWLWLFLDYNGTFHSSWCDGPTMIYDCDSSWIIMVPSLPAGVMDRPWSMIVTLPGLLWYLPFQLVWWTDQDLWLWLFLDHFDSFPSSWTDRQTMIYNCDSTWTIMIPSLAAAVLGRPWSMIVTLPGSVW